MAKSGHICLAIDFWNDGRFPDFLVPFAMRNAEMGSVLKGDTERETICHVYDDVLENYNIQNKVSFIVTDNESHNIKAFTPFPPE